MQDEQPKPKVQPNCVKCGGAEFTWTTKNFGGTLGMLIFCEGCGGVVGWHPKK